MITIKQITAAWRERHLPECVNAVLRNTGQAALNIKLVRMAFFFLLFSLVKPQGVSHSALRHSASASFNKNLFSGQAWGLGDFGLAESALVSVFQWMPGFSKLLLYLPWQQPPQCPGRRTLFSPHFPQLPSFLPVPHLRHRSPSLSTSHLPAFLGDTSILLLLWTFHSHWASPHFTIQAKACRKEYESTLCVENCSS